MQDQIFIRNLECFANHGVFKEEQVLGQKFLVSATLFMNTRIAGQSDKLEQSINYASVCEHIQKFMRTHTFQLIEAVAEQLAESILHAFDLIERLQLEIKKPWAPVCMSLDTVGISIERGWHQVYFGIGSNMGDKVANMQKAIAVFREHPRCKELKVSELIKTKPYGVTDQDHFMNGAFSVKTLMTPSELLEVIGRVEKELNRVREIHWGPRTIDVDILFYDDWIYADDRLMIPHKEIVKRDFVLSPLCQLSPYLVHPVYKKTVLELFEELKEKEDYESCLEEM